MRRARILSSVLGGVGLLASGVAEAAPTQPGELTNPLVRVEECEYCHTFNNDADDLEDPSYAPYFSWRGSMMANAAVDPVFWAGVAIASQDAAAAEETEACIRCHSPRAFLEGRGSATSIDDLQDRDLAGVTCELCHRMEDDGGIGNGQYAVDDTLVGGNVPRRGPWIYGADDIEPPPHSWVQDTFVGSSEACGTCHDVTTERPRVDDDGEPTGSNFNEQRTYSEWAGSAFADPGVDFRSCQDCHMPAVEDVAGCRDHVGVHEHESGGRRHDMVGANRFVVSLLAEDATVLDNVAFSHTLNVMDEFLETAATLEVSFAGPADLGEGLDGPFVTVTNLTGHKLPTGYSEGRVMWLEVIVRHEGEVLWESGTWDEAQGTMLEDPQLRTYQGVADSYSTGETLHLLRNDHWVLDTRIPPRGLTPDPQTDPVGSRYAVQDDGTWPHFDEVEYAFDPVPELADLDEGELEVSVRLLYLVNTRSYIDFLAAENQTNDAGNDVAMLFDGAGGATPMVLAHDVQLVPIANLGGTSTGQGSTSAGNPSSSGDVTSGGGGTTTSGWPSSATTTANDAGTSSGTDEVCDTCEGGCGCTSGEGGSGWLLLGFIGWAIRRRRR
ncbi:MAG: multiheme c-type cytochrome [Nannocystales bacterium]